MKQPSLTEENRIELIRLYSEKATQMLQDAEDMYAQGRWDIAANRYYYSCFHAIHALFVKNHLFSKSHDGMISLFGRDFVVTGKVPPSFGPVLNRLEELRMKADYNCVAKVTQEEIQLYQQEVRTFVPTILGLL